MQTTVEQTTANPFRTAFMPQFLLFLYFFVPDPAWIFYDVSGDLSPCWGS